MMMMRGFRFEVCCRMAIPGDWRCVVKLDDPDLEELAQRIDNCYVRLDEHDCSCQYCGTMFPQRCMRAKVLLRAIEIAGYVHREDKAQHGTCLCRYCRRGMSARRHEA